MDVGGAGLGLGNRHEEVVGGGVDGGGGVEQDGTSGEHPQGTGGVVRFQGE